MSFVSRKNLVAKLLNNKKYRDAYVLEHIKNGIPYQIRSLRDQRGWTQGYLGGKAGKRQHGISRLEDPRYGSKLSIKSLLEIASAFDVALLVKFVPFSKLLNEYDDVSPEALSANSIEDEADELEKWAADKEAQPIAAHAKDDLNHSQPLPIVPMILSDKMDSISIARWSGLQRLDQIRTFIPNADVNTEVGEELSGMIDNAEFAYQMGMTRVATVLEQHLQELAAKIHPKSVSKSNIVVTLANYKKEGRSKWQNKNKQKKARRRQRVRPLLTKRVA